MPIQTTGNTNSEKNVLSDAEKKQEMLLKRYSGEFSKNDVSRRDSHDLVNRNNSVLFNLDLNKVSNDVFNIELGKLGTS